MAQTLRRKTKCCHNGIWSRTVGQGVQNRGENHASAVVHLPQAFCSAKRGRREVPYDVISAPTVNAEKSGQGRFVDRTGGVYAHNRFRLCRTRHQCSGQNHAQN